MGAPVAVASLFRAPLESTFHWGQISPHGALRRGREDRVGQIKRVLKSSGLSMTEVSDLTCGRYGKKTAYYIPATFGYKQKVGVSPHICQIVALSQITGYPFSDWMAVFGFDLGLIFALQLRINYERTALVTPDTGQRSSVFRTNFQIVSPSKRYLFAKIGTRDAVAYPRVRPGSIVRADPKASLDSFTGRSGDEHLWLVEYPGGLVCSHVKRIDRENVVLLPNRPPLSAWPLRLSQEVRILGRVDLELWPGNMMRYEPKKCSTRYTLPRSAGNGKISFSEMLRSSRSRSGLTLRKAHEMTLSVSDLLHDNEYGIALGLLSDYEATNRLPRHIAKILSLCAVYGIDFWELMEAGGIQIDEEKRTMAAAA